MNLKPLLPFIKQASQSSNQKLAALASNIVSSIGQHGEYQEGRPEGSMVDLEDKPDEEGKIFDHSFKDLSINKDKLNSQFGKAEKEDDPKTTLKQQLRARYVRPAGGVPMGVNGA
jgi:hypothetical protein